MRFLRKICPVLLAGLFALLAVSIVVAQGIVIDGDFDDWIDQVSAVDAGGSDDERSPSYADINEFRAYADSKGLYLLKTWDDTLFEEPSTAGVTVQTAKREYYRIYSTAQKDFVPLESLNIKVCTDSTCRAQKDVCGVDTRCPDAKAGSGITWLDPFGDRRKKAPDCREQDECVKYDTAVELYIPWKLVGGIPEDKQTIFLYFGSYPKGPAPTPQDNTEIGIACVNAENNWKCYPVKPTAVTISSFDARATLDDVMLLLGLGACAFALIVSIGPLRHMWTR